MGIFTSKKLLAELRVGFSNNKVFVSMENISIDNIQTFDKSKLLLILYLYFLDRVLVNMSEKVSVATLDSIYTLGTQFVNKIKDMNDLVDWEIRKLDLVTPNRWVFTDSEEDFNKADFTATAKLFSKDDKIFCETNFSKVQLVEVKSYLLMEALLFFVTQKSDFEDYVFYFLPALLAQCSFYNGKRPNIAQIGQAVNFGLKQAEEARKNYGIGCSGEKMTINQLVENLAEIIAENSVFEDKIWEKFHKQNGAVNNLGAERENILKVEMFIAEIYIAGLLVLSIDEKLNLIELFNNKAIEYVKNKGHFNKITEINLFNELVDKRFLEYKGLLKDFIPGDFVSFSSVYSFCVIIVKKITTDHNQNSLFETIFLKNILLTINNMFDLIKKFKS